MIHMLRRPPHLPESRLQCDRCGSLSPYALTAVLCCATCIENARSQLRHLAKHFFDWQIESREGEELDICPNCQSGIDIVFTLDLGPYVPRET